MNVNEIDREIDKEKAKQRAIYKDKRAKYLELRKELTRLTTLPDNIVQRAKDDFDFFCSTFCWTYDPRVDDSELRTQPFILYPFQESAALEIIGHIIGKKDLLIEKSRDMGATWLILAIYLWGFLFHKWHLKVGSRKDEAVDKYGDMDTLFERMRFMIRNLHTHFGAIFKEKEHFREKLIKHPIGENAIVGEATTKTFSRSGRYTSILLDEFAFVEPEESEAIWQACGDSTPCRIALSTPPIHMRGKFVNLRMSGKIDILTLHWTLHPYKDTVWYEKEKKRRSKKEVAVELDIDYTASSDDRLITMNEIKTGMLQVKDTTPASNRIIAVDLARFGEDSTVIKIGWKNSKGQAYVAQTYKMKQKKATQVLGFLKQIHKPGDLVVFDAVGMGQSFWDFLEEATMNILPFVGSEKSANPNILNRRSEAYFTLCDAIRKGLIRDDDEIARQELLILWFDYNSTGKKFVISKERMRSQGIKSPDHADALAMFWWGARLTDVIVEDNTSVLWKMIKAEVNAYRGNVERWEEIDESEFESVT